jgi:hypothetical protein
MNKVYEIENEGLVRKEISKLRPISYNRFRWWRKFDQRKKPLPDNAPLLDKIKNGDLEFSQYWWQAKFSEIEINETYAECGHDMQKLLESHAIDLNRRKRLWQDFERDENEKLTFIRRKFIKEFYMGIEDYEGEITKFDGSLEDLYHYCSTKYGKKIKIKKRKKIK